MMTYLSFSAPSFAANKEYVELKGLSSFNNNRRSDSFRPSPRGSVFPASSSPFYEQTLDVRSYANYHAKTRSPGTPGTPQEKKSLPEKKKDDKLESKTSPTSRVQRRFELSQLSGDERERRRKEKLESGMIMAQKKANAKQAEGKPQFGNLNLLA